MSKPIISVEDLGKGYLISHKAASRGGLRHSIEDAVRAPLRWITSRGRQTTDIASQEEFWALKDVSFEVNQGEVVGIIGRNGAGKSTLLKLLSRITEPTTGRIRLRGRVATLLEVGTGFHQELTGRENIFLNGAILGMRRAEIVQKFDEIVAFAAVEKFLDTPVKRYSSGMYVRLAFAVAAHLQPDILIVDEVLAVGDIEFQKKCIGKMSEVARSGRTVLFVSHNMASLSALCERGILLHNGQKHADGPLSQVIERYHRMGALEERSYTASPNGKPVQVMRVDIASLSEGDVHVSGTPLRIRVVVRCNEPIKHGCLSIQIVNYQGTPVLHLRAFDDDVYFGRSAGESILECEVPDCWLNVGHHSLNVYLSDPPGGGMFEGLNSVCPFDVEVRNSRAWFGLKPELCCYLQKEQWSVSDSVSKDSIYAR